MRAGADVLRPDALGLRDLADIGGGFRRMALAMRRSAIRFVILPAKGEGDAMFQIPRLARADLPAADMAAAIVGEE